MCRKPVQFLQFYDDLGLSIETSGGSEKCYSLDLRAGEGKENFMDIQQSILNYWFGNSVEQEKPSPEILKRWFNGGAAVDQEIREQFVEHLEPALNDEYDQWCTEPRGALALIILLDQFPRNIHRGSGKMFHYDAKALSLAKAVVDRGDDHRLAPLERTFIYLPFEHSEVMADQDRSIELFDHLNREATEGLKGMTEGFLDYAHKHAVIIERFGRFPHRTDLLGRVSTEEEIEFLKEPGSSF